MEKKSALKIFYPLQIGENNSVLRLGGKKVEIFSTEIFELATILMDLMREYDGVGLAAPQIGKNVAMIATTQRKKIPNGKSVDNDFISQTLLINPQIIEASGKLQISEEACLSLPGKQGQVERYQRVVVSYQDVKGKKRKKKYSGFNASIVQHEIDHLNGVLFVDKLVKK